LPAAVAVSAERALAAARAAGGSPADRELHDALLVQNEVALVARAELFSAPGADEERRRSRQVADLGWALLGARARTDGELARAVAGRIERELGS
jgi:hypothetical protein